MSLLVSLLLMLRVFVPEYHDAKFGGNWTTNNGETEGWGTMCPPAYILTKYPSLNGVKVPSVLCHSQKDATRDWPSLVKLGTSY